MTHSLRMAALAVAGTLLAAAAAEACPYAPLSGYTAGYYPGYSAASYAPSYVSTSYYGSASYGAAYGPGCCTPSYSYYAPACGTCGDPCGGGCGMGCGMGCGSCDPCGGCGMSGCGAGGCGAGGCGVGGCGVGGCEPALPTPAGQPTPAGGPVPRDPAAPGAGGAPPRNPTFIEEPLPQDTRPRDDSGFGPLRDNGSSYDSDRQPPGNPPPAGQPDGFAPKQPTFDAPGGSAPAGGGTFGAESDTRLRLPSFGPWRPEGSEPNVEDEPTPRDGKADSVRGRRAVPALNLDDKIARRPAPQRTRLTARGESSWQPVAQIERQPKTTATNAGWVTDDAPARLVRK